MCPGIHCLPQRAALIKSLLNFLKKSISDMHFAELVRHIFDGGLSMALKHIISNPDFYGASLFLLGKVSFGLMFISFSLRRCPICTKFCQKIIDWFIS